MKKKQILLLLLLIALVVMATAPAYAASEVKVYVNGKQIVSDVPAVIKNGRTMLPFRAVFNALGVKDENIKWNADSRTVEVNAGVKGATYVFLSVGGTGAIAGDKLVDLDVAPYISNGRTLVPVRFVSETLKAKVEWNEKTRVVTITKK